MKPSEVIEKIIFTGDKLHYPDNGFGYDMKYYPAFEFYYSKMLQKHCPRLTSTFFEYRLNAERFRKTTIGDLATNRKLGDTGTFIKHLENNERFKKELVEVYNETGFYTSPELIEYLQQNGVSIQPNHLPSNGVVFSNFKSVFSGYVRFLVDNEWSFLNIKSLKVVDLDDAFFENRNDLRQIAINITPQSAANIASLLARDIDDNDNSFEDLKEADEVDASVLEEVHMSLSSKSRRHFENLLGMKFVIDCLNDFD